MNIPNTHKKVMIFIGVTVFSLLGFYSINMRDKTDKILSDESSIVRSSKKTQSKLDGKIKGQRINVQAISDKEEWENRLVEITKLKDGFQRAEALIQLGREMAYEDPIAAYELIEKMEKENKVDVLDSPLILQGISFTHAENDPQQALVTALEKFGLEKSNLFKTQRKWPAMTLEHVMRGVFRGWGKVDPEAAVQYAQNDWKKYFKERHSSLERLYSWKNTEDLHNIIDRNSSNSVVEYYSKEYYDSFDKKLLPLRHIFHSWAKQNPEAAIEYASSLNGNVKKKLIPEIYRSMAAIDPQNAIKQAMQIEGDSLRTNTLHKVMASWSRINTNEVLDWTSKTFKDLSEKDNLLMNVIRETYIDSPSSAAQIYNSLQDETQSETGWVYNIAKLWIRRDSDSTIDWTLNIKNKEKQDLAIEAIAGSLARTDLQPAIDGLFEMNRDDRDLSNIRELQTERLQNQFPLIEKFPNGPLRNKVIARYAEFYLSMVHQQQDLWIPDKYKLTPENKEAAASWAEIKSELKKANADLMKIEEIVNNSRIDSSYKQTLNKLFILR